MVNRLFAFVCVASLVAGVLYGCKPGVDASDLLPTQECMRVNALCRSQIDRRCDKTQAEDGTWTAVDTCKELIECKALVKKVCSQP